MLHKKTMMTLLLILTLITSYSLAEEVTMYVDVESTSCLNVRSSPKKTSTNLAFQLDRNDKVTVYKIQGSWSYISYAGDYGWCMSEFLANNEILDPEDFRVTSNGRVKVRLKPNGKKLSYVYDSEVVTVTSWTTDKNGIRWGKTHAGYIDERFLRRLDKDE